MRNKNKDQLDIAVLLDVLVALKNGDTSRQMPNDMTGMAGKVADALNQIILNKRHLTASFEEMAIAINKEGRINQRINLDAGMQQWGKTAENINAIADGLSSPITEITRVVAAVSRGDLAQTIDIESGGLELKGEFLRSAKLVNSMVAQLNHFSNEVYKVVQEVGTEGKLGGLAQTTEMHGRWKELTDS